MTIPVIRHQPQETGDQKTYIAILLDRSGSMQIIKDATIEAFNGFIDGQKLQPGAAYFTLCQFDTEAIEFLYEVSTTPRRLDATNYVPRGGTPLLDAIGTIVDHAKRYTTHPSPYDRHVLVIQTDGEENSSKEYNLDAVRKLLKELEEARWQIIYLGAGIDAYHDMKAHFGTQSASSYTYLATTQSAQTVGQQVTNSVTDYRASGAVASADWAVGNTDASVKERTEEEKKKLTPKAEEKS